MADEVKFTVIVWLGAVPETQYSLADEAGQTGFTAVPLYCIFQPALGSTKLIIVSVRVMLVLVPVPLLQRLIWKPKVSPKLITVLAGKASVPLHWPGGGEMAVPLMETMSLSEVLRLPTPQATAAVPPVELAEAAVKADSPPELTADTQ